MRAHLWQKLSEPMRDPLAPFTCLHEAWVKRQFLPAWVPGGADRMLRYRSSTNRRQALVYTFRMWGLSLQHKLVPPDRYNGPVHVTNGNLQFLIQPHLAFRFPLCFIKLSGPKSALKPPNTKLSPGLWLKTDTCCYTAHSNPVKLQCRPTQIPYAWKQVQFSSVSVSKQEAFYESVHLARLTTHLIVQSDFEREGVWGDRHKPSLSGVNRDSQVP